MAELAEESDALNARVAQSNVSALAGGYVAVLDDFEAAILTSKAVIARSLAVIQDLFQSGNRTYTTYHLELAAQARVPEDNEFDRTRTQFEAALFPNFHKEIRYGALTLDGTWLILSAPRFTGIRIYLS